MSPSNPRAPGDAAAGQASLEWLAVVALVATLLAVGAALAQAGYVGRRVTREMARAICVVGAGDCARDREPCVVGAHGGGQAMTVDIVILRLGEDTFGLVERRSDGTFAVTVERGGTAGVGASEGLGAGFSLGGVDVSVGGEVAASLVARLGRGRTWIVGSAAEAQRLLEDQDGAPEPDVTSGDGSLTSSAEASLGVTALADVDVAQGGLTFDRQAGWSVDRRTGHRTVYVQASWATTASAGGRGVLGLSGGEESYAVELDRTGRPVDLRVIAAGRFGGSRDLPAVAQPVAGLLAAGDGDDRAYEVTSHLDLTDATNLAAARDLLNAIAARRATAAPSQALRRRIAERGTVEARILAERSRTDGGSFHVNLHTFELGGRAEVRQRSQQLLAATSRGLDGQWLPRTDCVPDGAS
jgi:hypothetical protein